MTRSKFTTILDTDGRMSRVYLSSREERIRQSNTMLRKTKMTRKEDLQ